MENNIQFQRKMKGLSQEELAKRCSVSRQTINAIENNKYDPSLQLAFTLSNVIGIPLEALFIFKYERNEEK
ncbi:helix-turn-helix transcriptional regulator [Bacillus sp. MB2021]|uniref:helix-turn-helix transcriptional regulator n=1 Tax=Bacillus sp. MB2021 TaxID=1408303 RepID=UPI0004E2023C|nr:helix-turn-helix transcriptional regulator [Bacillus sp. MB2021]